MDMRMPSAPHPPDEAERLAALHRLGILDTPPDPEFDALVQAAALVCEVPISLISLVGSDRQWFKSQIGLGTSSGTARDIAFCAHTILGDAVLEVRDATCDPRFLDNPLVTGAPNIRFYAGVPLCLNDGSRVGTLCVIDRTPRRLDDRQRAILRSLAVAAGAALENWRVRNAHVRTEQALLMERQRMAHLIAATDVGTWEINVQTGETLLNERWAQMFGWTLAELEAETGPISAATNGRLTHPEDGRDAATALQHHLDGHTERYQYEYRMLGRNGHVVWVLSQGKVVLRTPDGRPEWVFGTLTDIGERKREQAARRKNEEFLDRTGRCAGVGGWEYDPHTETVTWSDETARITGMPPGYQPNLDEALRFYPPEARPVIASALQESLENGTGWDLELPLIKAGGQRIWVRVIGSAVMADGEVSYLTGAFQDVTDRVIQREALERARERVVLATEGAGIGVWDLDLATDTLVWDEQMYRLYGRTPHADVTCYDMWSFHLHPEDREAAEADLHQGVKTGGKFDSEFRIILPDGSIRHIRALAQTMAGPHGKAIRMVGVNWDVTEARLLAIERDAKGLELAESEATLRLIAENVSDVICWVGADGAWRYVSPAVKHLFDVTSDYLIESGHRLPIHPDDVERAEILRGGLLAGTITEGSLTFRVNHPARGEIWVETNSRAVEVSVSGAPAGYVAVLRDVTDRMQLEAERAERARELQAGHTELERMTRHLLRARDAADRANAAKSRFLAGMSHELRTPLNGILGYARLLRLEGNLSAGQALRVESMLGAGAPLLEMIHCVLDLSEIETERDTLRPEAVDVRPMAAASLDVVRLLAEEKHILLHLDVEPGLPPAVMADPVRLRQVLLNLLGNAAKFTSTGRIALRLCTEGGGTRLRFEVADTGPGIPHDERQRLFQEFGRIRSESTRAAEGAGLGLALSARLATLMGGHLEHLDNPGGGSVFRLEIPLLACDAGHLSASEPGIPIEYRPGRALRVLVVDDSEMNLDIAASFIRAGGHDVMCAGGGIEAIAEAATTAFDVILMDVQMPDMDGLEATRRIRALPGSRALVPIYALTAQVFTEQMAACHAAGMTGHLAKPFTEAALFSMLDEVARGGVKQALLF